jgi:hypothetical protein
VPDDQHLCVQVRGGEAVMNADRVGDSLAWRRACSGPAFVALKVGRFRLVRALLIIYLASYTQLTREPENLRDR